MVNVKISCVYQDGVALEIFRSSWNMQTSFFADKQFDGLPIEANHWIPRDTIDKSSVLVE